MRQLGRSFVVQFTSLPITTSLCSRLVRETSCDRRRGWCDVCVEPQDDVRRLFHRGSGLHRVLSFANTIVLTSQESISTNRRLSRWLRIRVIPSSLQVSASAVVDDSIVMEMVIGGADGKVALVHLETKKVVHHFRVRFPDLASPDSAFLRQCTRGCC